MKSAKIFVVALAVLTGWAAPIEPAKIESPDLIQIRAIMRASIAEMNQQGRIPLDGIAGGMANNVWQTISHPSDPSRLGCGWQANHVLPKLQRIPGWTFELRYEIGFSSPIFLPHQWITAHGPHGRILQIDPWDGITEANR